MMLSVMFASKFENTEKMAGLGLAQSIMIVVYIIMNGLIQPV